jgi:hypothetical protein
MSRAAKTLSAVPPLIRSLLVLTCAAGVMACADQEEALGSDAQVAVLRLGGPTLEIGAVDGPEEIVFAALETVLRLPNGNVAISDAGASRISIFDASGDVQRSWGQRGDGPGEFRNLSRLFPLGNDSLIAAERAANRVTSFDLQGGPGRTFPATDLSGDSVFRLDSWLHGRFWVDGALSPAERRRVTTILDRLPPPREDPGYRRAFAGDDGSLWVREPGAPGGVQQWTRLDAEGTPSAILSMPARFRPTQFRADELLGVWTGESDVHFARAYRIEEASGTTAPPEWLLASPGDAGDDGLEVPTREALLTEIREAIKQMASAQEIHYSQHMTYTTSIDSMSAFERPDNIVVDFARGDSRGWAGVFTHRSVGRICALAYGFNTPAGWAPGSILCAPQMAMGTR